MVHKVLLKKHCPHCDKDTEKYKKKTVKFGKGVVDFTVCLECGEPIGYKSYSHLVNELHKKSSKKRRKDDRQKKKVRPTHKTKDTKKIGKAGLEEDTYKLYLQTDHWAALRHKKLQEQPLCEMCCDKRATQVHHLRYRYRNGEPILYKEKLGDLLSVCRKCHEKIHHI